MKAIIFSTFLCGLVLASPSTNALMERGDCNGVPCQAKCPELPCNYGDPGLGGYVCAPICCAGDPRGDRNIGGVSYSEHAVNICIFTNDNSRIIPAFLVIPVVIRIVTPIQCL